LIYEYLNNLRKEEFLAVAERDVIKDPVCPNCGQEKLQEPRVCYSVRGEKDQPVSVCGNCGALVGKRDKVVIPVLSPKALPLFLLPRGKTLLFLPEGGREPERSASPLAKKEKRRMKRNTPLWVLKMWARQDRRAEEKKRGSSQVLLQEGPN